MTPGQHGRSSPYANFAGGSGLVVQLPWLVSPGEKAAEQVEVDWRESAAAGMGAIMSQGSLSGQQVGPLNPKP